MKTLRNKKAQVGTMLGFVISILLFLFIGMSALIIYNNIALADIKAQNAVRNLGVVFDVLPLTTKEAIIDADCPPGMKFLIEKNRITATYPSMLGEGFATYHYLAEKNAVLPDKKEIVCSGGVIEVKRSYSAGGINPIISVD